MAIGHGITWLGGAGLAGVWRSRAWGWWSRRRGVRRLGTAGAVPRGHRGGPEGLRPRSSTGSPATRRLTARGCTCTSRHGHRGGGLQRRAPRGCGVGALHGRRRRRSRARSSRPTAEQLVARPARSSATAGPPSPTTGSRPPEPRRCSSPAWSSGATLTNDTATTTCCGAWDASWWRRPSRRAPCWRPTTTPTGAPVAGVYSKYYTGRDVLGARPPASTVPRGRLGRGRGSDRRLPRRRSATTSRTTGLPCPITGPPTGWPRPSPSTTGRRAPAHRGRARLRPPPGGALRRAGAVGEPALRAMGRAGPQPPRAPRWRLRRRRRGAHRPVASGRGRPAPGRPARPRR